MIWTVLLVLLASATLYFSPHYWWGWVIGAASEFVWLYYSLKVVHAPPLAIMSVIYFALYIRAARTTYRKAHS